MTDHVTVCGRVVAVGGKRSLIPPLPEAIAERRTDCAVTLIGSDLPPTGMQVSVDGQLSGSDLTVSAWHPEATTPASWEATRQFQGVDPAISHAALISMPPDWDVISTGESKTSEGRRVAVIHLVRATPEVTSWLTEQVPGSVYLYPFIREMGTESVLTAGTAGSPRQDST
jgi:hypothetical protein